MSAVASFVLQAGYVFLLLAFVSRLLPSSIRTGGRHRLDVLALTGLLLAIPLLRPVSVPAIFALRLTCMALLPYALIRLARHLRDISAWHTVAALGTPATVLAAALLVGQFPRADAFGVAVVYMISVFTFVAVVFFGDTRNSIGVRRNRLLFATLATSCLAASFLVALIVSLAAPSSRQFGPIIQLSQGVSFICFYFAFAPPRVLVDRWRRAEHANYLARTSEREPEERGRKASDDLFEATVRAVGGATTFVALKAIPSEATAEVKAASAPALLGLQLDANTGLIGRGLAGTTVSGSLAELDEAIANHLATVGGEVLIAPIASANTIWGVIFVLHRRGALFPDDDLAMLTQLGRTAATALDHSLLVLERRERERSIADRRLRELESRVGLMLDSIKDYAMLLLDDTGRVAAWHLGAQHLFGYEPGHVTDRSAAAMYGVTPSELSEWLIEARRNGFIEREGECRRFDGTTFTGTTIIRPLVNEPGEPPGFVVVTHDVTDRRNLEDRLRQGQKMEAIGQLAGGVAHDFNNLLTAILGYADWLERDLANDPRRSQVGEIQRAAERAADLTRQLLAFSRRQTLQLADMDLGRLTGEIVPLLRRLIGEHIEVVDATSPGAYVHGDRSQLEQVVLNLAVNARDAMPAGGKLTIRTATVMVAGDHPAAIPPGEYVLLEVADTGTGMDAETRRRAFEPFFTTKDVGRGTGLGLSTVYGIAQQMNGVVELESELGRGSTFRLYFPRAEAAEDARPAAYMLPLPRGHETVLLVEDDDAVRSYLAGVLESNGYDVIAADHPRTALALTEESQKHIDLVISDVVMPGSTGPELVRLLGKAHPGVSALFISGYSGDAVEPVAGPADTPLLQKPFSSTELLSRVRQILSAA